MEKEPRGLTLIINSSLNPVLRPLEAVIIIKRTRAVGTRWEAICSSQRGDLKGRALARLAPTLKGLLITRREKYYQSIICKRKRIVIIIMVMIRTLPSIIIRETRNRKICLKITRSFRCLITAITSSKESLVKIMRIQHLIRILVIIAQMGKEASYLECKMRNERTNWN